MVVVATLSARPARADDVAHLAFANDNDFWVFRGEDRGYSNGLEARLRLPLVAQLSAERTLLSLSIGQAMYTPSDLRETSAEALRRDHPYIGWLWATAGIEQLAGPVRYGAEVRAGLVGPHAFGREAQIAWHSWNLAPTPLGWQVLEVGDAADVALRTQAALEAPRAELAVWATSALALVTAGELSCEVGTLRVLCEGGPWVRAGLLRRAGASTPALTSPVAPLFADSNGARPVELFVFAGLAARLTARDRVLEGDVCDGDGACGPTWVKRRPLVSERRLGVAGAARGWSLSFTYVRRSAELSSPAALSAPQQFGRLALGVSW